MHGQTQVDSGNRCPKCGQSHLFVHGNAYNLRHTAKMHAACPSCGEDFEREPDFTLALLT